MEEIWINTGNKEHGRGSHRKCTILQFSNLGRIRLSTGEIMDNEFTQHPIYKKYFISRDGRFYFIKKDGTKSDISRGTITKNKYGKPLCYEVCITVSEGVYKVSNVGRLVLETYVGLSPKDKPEIDYISQDPLDNNVENLRWSNRRDNMLNRKMPTWSTDRHARRLETAHSMGYETWGDLIRDKRRKAKLKKEQKTK